MHYPCNYGYVPQTLSDDGDPVDVLVITPFPLIPGVVVPCRPIGMLKMDDEAGGDAKLLAVPIDKILPIYTHWQKPEDMNQTAPEADPALLRALQGPGAGQVGQGRRLGRARGGARRGRATGIASLRSTQGSRAVGAESASAQARRRRP